MSQQLNLQEKTIDGLKVIAYDVSALIQHYTSILNNVNQEINRRAQEQATLIKEVAKYPATERALPIPSQES